ncbi:cardiolipin synthase [Microvirga terricola]|uniref:Cardiolipin synthase n=1 Tax=Microvirga terricola TaxID=2719797 RepID=A0ABX0VER3_9HYPH|nr:cardiolipin synthase [Microvirga terricola]NIX76377.1 cardiolipin synthase [Microvirga terricola]
MSLIGAISWAEIYLASEWVIRIVMLIVVPFRRSPEAAKGWLLFVFFLPWPALIVYLFIGRPAYPRWRRERFARLPVVFKTVTDRVREVTARQEPDLPANLIQAATLIQNLGRFPSLDGNAAELLTDYQGSIDRLVADIDKARSHIHLLFYIFANDETGWKVISALTRATERGVTCRVLIDALGSRPWAASVVEALKAGGVAVQLVLPVSLLRPTSTRADLRNHRKIAVIDGEIGYVGSQNIVNADFNAGIVNQELVVRTRGPVVLELQAVFVADWFLETEEVLDDPALFPEPRRLGDIVAQVLPSGPDYPEAGTGRLIEAMVHGARKRVVMTTPYFIPNEALLNALETAVLRGVEVHIVLSRPVDQVLVNLAQRSYYAELLEAGVRIHLYRDKLLHAKTVSVDNRVSLIGSSNIDIRSFVLNAEASVILFDREVNRLLRKEQERYFAASETLTLEAWNARPLYAKATENIARLMSPLL